VPGYTFARIIRSQRKLVLQIPVLTLSIPELTLSAKTGIGIAYTSTSLTFLVRFGRLLHRTHLVTEIAYRTSQVASGYLLDRIESSHRELVLPIPVLTLSIAELTLPKPESASLTPRLAYSSLSAWVSTDTGRMWYPR